MYVVLFFGLAAAIFWGVADFLGAKASKKLGPIMSAFLISLLGTILYVLLFFTVFHSHAHLTSAVFWYASVGGAFVTLGTLSFYKGLAIGPVSIVSPIGAVYPLVTTLLATSIFHAHLTRQDLAGIVLIVFGVMLAGELLGVKDRRSLRSNTGPLFGLGSALGWGIGYTLMAQATKQSDWQLATLIEFIAIAAVYCIVVPFIQKDSDFSWREVRKLAKDKLVLWAAFILFLGGLAFNAGLGHETASGAIVSALSACYPAITIILALRHFDEQVKLLPLAGAALCILGVVVTTLG